MKKLHFIFILFALCSMSTFARNLTLEELTLKKDVYRKAQTKEKDEKQIKKVMDNLIVSIKNLKSKQSTPVTIRVVMKALKKWVDDNSKYSYSGRCNAIAKGPSTSPKKSWKCNRFVADCYGEVVGWSVSIGVENKTGKSGYPLAQENGLRWPPNANSLARKNANIRSFTYARNIRKGRTPKLGDIISFPSETIGHTSIYVGNGYICEARSHGVDIRPLKKVYPGRPAMARSYTGSGN